MPSDDQVYIVVDVETNGPVPGLYSMLSIGAIATTTHAEVGNFYRKISPYEEAGENPATMQWWKTQPEAWKEATSNAEQPEAVMCDFTKWVKGFGNQAIFVAHPVAFDYSFVGWYLHKFAGENPFSDGGGPQKILDLASFTAGRLGLPLNLAVGSRLPESLKVGMPEHSHLAIDDARGHGVVLRNVFQANSHVLVER